MNRRIPTVLIFPIEGLPEGIYAIHMVKPVNTYLWFEII